MTREEARTELSVLWERFNNGMGWRDGQYEEALDMEIEALQTQNISKSESYADDLISRADVKAEATKFFGHWVVFENRIDNLPSVSAECVGEWIFKTNIICGNGREGAGYVCSVCGVDFFHVDGMKYCPNCGAYMGERREP